MTKQEPKSELWLRYVGDGRYMVLKDEEISDKNRRRSTENKLWKEATERVLACDQDVTDAQVSSGATLRAPTLACGHPQRLSLEPDTTGITKSQTHLGLTARVCTELLRTVTAIIIMSSMKRENIT
jgi:hypothetical protein